MKKVLLIVTIIFSLTLGVFAYSTLNKITVYGQEDGSLVSNDIKDKLIRFHVIANSDDKKDQELKLKVRDEILNYISPKLKDSKSIDESRKILKENDEKIKQIAAKVIKDNGYRYSVTSTLDHENFPVKTYGNITLPQGDYEAYRVIIGEGKGQNWWCVMFPPLCFIDITKGQVSYDQTEKQMKRVLTDKEYEEVNNQKSKDKDKIIFTFKVKEMFDNITKKK
ncbi:stage II sporulation protein R [Clostridium manihotivorum]|uniref:Stage II sporulation protein R n=1 Tax=Clostridium manihotivorum TaxID=2320868 RepID=A0A3R5UE89_9CLOT|nr:stage II sporulation protein R [Clostridium manihotivorum]QAA31415.1 stage II sporulation protein R [Clostridium manihotivorum]